VGIFEIMQGYIKYASTFGVGSLLVALHALTARSRDQTFSHAWMTTWIYVCTCSGLPHVGLPRMLRMA
jgi:hypothetical protein